jgi:cold shock CspA family protein
MDGTVTAFDDPRGWGTIEADGTEYPFHCTALLDGTRTIEVGTTVTFEVRPAAMGRWEATAIAARPPSS